MPEESVTELLHRLSSGDKGAEQVLMARVYPDLHAMARMHFNRENPGHLLQPTALVNEVYLKLLASSHGEWKDRSHFFAVASRVMRQVLTDHARKANTDKRGGGAQHFSLDIALIPSGENFADLLVLDEALLALEQVKPRLTQVVVCRYFGDMKDEEIAESLGVSTRTVKRDWEFSRAWLRDWLAR